jgi:beta-lactamase superfamily II metal-dependent hydrolase
VDALADEPFSDDAAPPNGSSIALLAEFEGAAVLFGADAYASMLSASIRRLLEARGKNRLKLDAFKLPHHGSRNNLSTELLQLVDCPRYLLSSNGNHFFHPDRQAVARTIRYGRRERTARPTLYFNYRSRNNDVWDDPELKERYAYTPHYPKPGSDGLRLSLLATP